jgi:hypothetical protein
VGALLSADRSAGALGFLWPSIGRLGIFAYMGVGVDTLGTLGYTAAIQYVHRRVGGARPIPRCGRWPNSTRIE